MQHRRGGFRNAERESLHFVVPRPVADKVQRRAHVGPELTKRTHGGQKVGHKRRTRFGGAAKADTWQTQGGHMADKWQGRFGKADSRDTWQTRFGGTAEADCGHTADTWRIKRGDAAKAESAREADTRRTSSGARPEHIAARFFLRDYTSIDLKEFLKHRVRLQRPNLGNQNECQGN